MVRKETWTSRPITWKDFSLEAKELCKTPLQNKREIPTIVLFWKEKIEFGTSQGGREYNKHLGFSFGTTGEVHPQTPDKPEVDRALTKQQNQLSLFWIKVICSHYVSIPQERIWSSNCQPTAFSSFSFYTNCREMPHPKVDPSQEGPHQWLIEMGI